MTDTAFHKQSFNTRLGTMGDPAELACDKVYAYRTHKLGLDRVWQNGVGLFMAQMTPQMRYTPDRMVIDRFVECMGIGRDGTLKIKHEKIKALHYWADIGPTDLFVFDQTKNTYYQADIADWYEACVVDGEVKAFPEGKQYYALHRDHFPTQAEAVPDVEAPTSI